MHNYWPLLRQKKLHLARVEYFIHAKMRKIRKTFNEKSRYIRFGQ